MDERRYHLYSPIICLPFFITLDREWKSLVIPPVIVVSCVMSENCCQSSVGNIARCVCVRGSDTGDLYDVFPSVISCVVVTLVHSSCSRIDVVIKGGMMRVKNIRVIVIFISFVNLRVVE